MGGVQGLIASVASKRLQTAEGVLGTMFKPLGRLLLYKRSRGQMGVLFMFALVAMVGAMTLGADMAVRYFTWMNLQKAADAGVLAGAYYLPSDTSMASSTAISYAKSNGVKDGEITTPTFANSNTQITMQISRNVPYYFGRVLGLTNGVVSVSSTASPPNSPSCIGCAGPSTSSTGGVGGTGVPTGSVSPTCGASTGQYNVIPIAVSNKTQSKWSLNGAYTLNETGTSGKNNAWVDSPGNWGLIDLCGGGSSSGSVVQASIANGFFGPIAIGQTLNAVPGNKSGPLSSGFASRINASADTFDPTTGQGFDPNNPRAVIVPLVSWSSCGGSTCTPTVTGFMSFWIDSYSGGNISGHFINMVAASSIGSPTVTSDAGLTGNPILLK